MLPEQVFIGGGGGMQEGSEGGRREQRPEIPWP